MSNLRNVPFKERFLIIYSILIMIINERIKASAKDGVGAGRGPCGLRNSELGPRPHDVLS